MNKKYFNYIIPSMFSFLLSGVYSIVDGLFVGNAVGDYGLAAINIAWPMVAALISLGTGLGMGGSVITSLNRGSNKEHRAAASEANTITLLIGGGVLITLILFLLKDSLLVILGAREQTMVYAAEYMDYLLLGGVIQVCASGMIPLIRNRGHALLAMISMGGGFIANIILDWLFVFELGLGMKGAAIATVLGQIITLLPCIYFFMISKHKLALKSYIPNVPLFRQISKVALSPFGLTYLPSVTIILINLQSNRYGGAIAVSAYAVLSYIASFTLLTIQGISDGSQPLLSLSLGSGNYKDLKHYQKLTFLLAIGVGTFGGIMVIALKHQIPMLFGSSKEASALIIDALPIFALSFVLYGFTKAAISYFYATNNVVKSSCLVYGEAVVTIILCLVLPLFMGLLGVWLTILAAQIILTLVGAYFLIWKKEERFEHSLAPEQ